MCYTHTNAPEIPETVTAELLTWNEPQPGHLTAERDGCRYDIYRATNTRHLLHVGGIPLMAGTLSDARERAERIAGKSREDTQTMAAKKPAKPKATPAAKPAAKPKAPPKTPKKPKA